MTEKKTVKSKTMTELQLLPIAVVLALCAGPACADVECGESFVTLPGYVRGSAPIIEPLPEQFITIEKDTVRSVETIVQDGGSSASTRPTHIVILTTYRLGKGQTVRLEVVSSPAFREDLVDCLD